MRICCNGRTNGPKSTEQQLAGPEQSAIKSATDAIAGAREGNEYDDDGLEHRVPSSRTIGLVHRYCSVNDRYSLNAVLLDSSSTVTESDEIRHGSAGMTLGCVHRRSNSLVFDIRTSSSKIEPLLWLSKASFRSQNIHALWTGTSLPRDISFNQVAGHVNQLYFATQQRMRRQH